MSASGVEMHFGRDLRFFQRQKVDGGVLDMDRIVFGLKDERRRGLVSNVDFGIGSEVLFGESEVAGIDDHCEVGPATDLIGARRWTRTGACRSEC